MHSYRKIASNGVLIEIVIISKAYLQQELFTMIFYCKIICNAFLEFKRELWYLEYNLDEKLYIYDE